MVRVQMKSSVCIQWYKVVSRRSNTDKVIIKKWKEAKWIKSKLMLLLNDTKLLSERVPEKVQINFGIKWYKVVSEKNKTDAVIIKKKQNGWSPDKHCDRMIQSCYRKEGQPPFGEHQLAISGSCLPTIK